MRPRFHRFHDLAGIGQAGNDAGMNESDNLDLAQVRMVECRGDFHLLRGRGNVQIWLVEHRLDAVAGKDVDESDRDRPNGTPAASMRNCIQQPST